MQIIVKCQQAKTFDSNMNVSLGMYLRTYVKQLLIRLTSEVCFQLQAFHWSKVETMVSLMAKGSFTQFEGCCNCRSGLWHCRDRKFPIQTYWPYLGDNNTIISDMIDRWSMGQAFFVVVVGFFQVYFLRKFFNAKPTPHRIAART